MPSIQDKNETEDDEMDQDTSDSDKPDDDDSESGSGTENEESSEMDEEECEKRKVGCLEDMAELERQFHDLKEQLYHERLRQVELKLEEVKAGRAAEYLNPLAQLQDNMRIRTQVAGVLKDLKIRNVQNAFEAENQAAKQNYESEKILLYDTLHQDIQDKIKRLEEDRHSIDITSDLMNESQSQRKRKRSAWNSERRRKAVQVTGPYVVYMLKETDIVEDWTTIKKALKQTEKAEKKKKEVLKPEKHPYSARFEDGKLFYEGEWYSRGHHIIIDNKEDSPVHVLKGSDEDSLYDPQHNNADEPSRRNNRMWRQSRLLMTSDARKRARKRERTRMSLLLPSIHQKYG